RSRTWAVLVARPWPRAPAGARVFGQRLPPADRTAGARPFGPAPRSRERVPAACRRLADGGAGLRVEEVEPARVDADAHRGVDRDVPVAVDARDEPGAVERERDERLRPDRLDDEHVRRQRPGRAG